MDSINVSRIRQELCDNNIIPKDFEGVFPDHPIYGTYSKIQICRTTVIITKQLKPLRHNGRYLPHPSGHRVYVLCPACGKRVPAGRLAQHYKIHERKV